MSCPEPRPLRADARRNRERIVEAARDVLAECGPAAAQMDDIARRAGVGVGTVYRHFPTKSALMGELMAAKFRQHAEAARRWAGEETEGWPAFEGFLRETFDAMARDATLQQRVAWSADSDALARAEAERQVLVEVVGGMIDRAHREGALREDFTVDDMPALMSAVGVVMAGGPLISRGADRIIAIVLDGLRSGVGDRVAASLGTQEAR